MTNHKVPLEKQFKSEIFEYSVIDFIKRNSVHPAETEQRKRIKEMSQKEKKKGELLLSAFFRCHS